MSKYNTFFDGQDISHRCVKCGSVEVVHKGLFLLEFAPFWSTCLALGGGLFKQLYRSHVRTGRLRLGFCKRHKVMGDVAQDVCVVLSLVMGGGMIVYAMHTERVLLALVGCSCLIGFYFFAKAGNVVRVVDISNGRITIKTNIKESY